jgi:hypothetical protein
MRIANDILPRKTAMLLGGTTERSSWISLAVVGVSALIVLEWLKSS